MLASIVDLVSQTITETRNAIILNAAFSLKFQKTTISSVYYDDLIKNLSGEKLTAVRMKSK